MTSVHVFVIGQGYKMLGNHAVCTPNPSKISSTLSCLCEHGKYGCKPKAWLDCSHSLEMLACSTSNNFHHEKLSSNDVFFHFHPNLNHIVQFESFGFAQKCREFVRTRSPPHDQTNDNSLTHFFRNQYRQYPWDNWTKYSLLYVL